jgi:murein DD-endopeptidase MepM/ murein hydrolase activator NlpD
MDFTENRFAEMVVEANGSGLKDFKHWLFCPAMLFNSPDKWWGDHGQRDFPHEGLDFCLYEGRSGEILRVDKNTRIPVMQDGVVRAIFTDYLGQAVVVEHRDARNNDRCCLSVYAHTKPMDGIQRGVFVEKGDVIATIADTSQSKANILPHLHLSLGIPSSLLSYDRFVWNRMRDPNLVSLIDPITIIDGHYMALDPQGRECLDV